MNTLIGKTIGQYRIVSEIGRGGMAIVYKAEQPRLNRFVALKVLLPTFTGEDSSVSRLQREACAAASLDHPNIVSIYEVGEHEGLHYIAMKFVEGRPLDALLKEQTSLPPDRVIRILAQVASALDYAHRRNLVHRDIKPSNILIGADDRVTLTDFGLVKSLGTATLTSSGALVGTPAYMSPEQARGIETDYRADIYSLGVVCFEMLAGRAPFEGNPLSIILAHASQNPPPLSALRPGFPPAAEAVVARALSKEPQDRFSTAGEFIAALRQALVYPHSVETPPLPAKSISAPTPPPPRLPTAPTPTRRRLHPVGWALSIIVILGATVAGFRFVDQGRAWNLLAGGPAPAGLPSATVTPADSPTPVPPTASATALPTATRTFTPPPTATRTATLLPSATSTTRPATATATWTPTLKPTQTATLTPAPTATATATPLPSPTPARPTPVPATLTLLGPADGQAFRSTETPVLRWSRSAPLAAGEQFVVVIDRTPPLPHSGVWHDYHITSAQSLTVPIYLAQTTADGRFEWYVQVMRGARVENGVLLGERVGAPSAKRVFNWDIIPTPTPGGDGRPPATPTRDFLGS